MLYTTIINGISFVINDVRSEITVDNVYVYICKFKKKHIRILNKMIWFGGNECPRLLNFTFNTNITDDCISLYYDADVGECFNIRLYRKDYTKHQQFYYNQVFLSYTHN